MRRVTATTFVSLDGVMQAPGGPGEDDSGGFAHGGWTVPHFDDTVGAALGKMFSRPFALLLGRKTYDIFAAHWPRAESGPDAALARTFNAATKYVATKSTAPLQWQNSLPVHDAAAVLPWLKQGDGPDLLIQGSGDLIQTLMADGLIDEFTLFVFPVVLGGGKRFFGRGAGGTAVELIESRTSSSGVTIGTYRPAGAVRTGSFALQ